VSPSPAKPSVQSLVRDYLKRRPEEQIGRRELAAVRRHVLEGLPAPRRIPDRYLIEVLEEAGADVARSLGGLPQDLRGRVHSGSFEAAASSLLDMQAEFSAAWGRGDRVRAEDCRRAVRRAKDRVKLILSRRSLSQQKRKEKQELLQWFLTWLENPDVFPQWLRLRLARLEQELQGEPGEQGTGPSG